jgi:large subunit ribosomal protein L4
MLNALKVSGKKILLLTAKTDTNIYRSGRNINKVSILEASNVSTYDILNSQLLILQYSAVEAISKTFREKEEKVVN